MCEKLKTIEELRALMNEANTATNPDRVLLFQYRVQTAARNALPHLLDIAEAFDELVAVGIMRNDHDLPHPADDSKLWTARMQTAWDDAIEKRNAARAAGLFGEVGK